MGERTPGAFSGDPTAKPVTSEIPLKKALEAEDDVTKWPIVIAEMRPRLVLASALVIGGVVVASTTDSTTSGGNDELGGASQTEPASKPEPEAPEPAVAEPVSDLTNTEQDETGQGEGQTFSVDITEIYPNAVDASEANGSETEMVNF